MLSNENIQNITGETKHLLGVVVIRYDILGTITRAMLKVVKKPGSCQSWEMKFWCNTGCKWSNIRAMAKQDIWHIDWLLLINWSLLFLVIISFLGCGRDGHYSGSTRWFSEQVASAVIFILSSYGFAPSLSFLEPNLKFVRFHVPSLLTGILRTSFPLHRKMKTDEN